MRLLRRQLVEKFEREYPYHYHRIFEYQQAKSPIQEARERLARINLDVEAGTVHQQVEQVRQMENYEDQPEVNITSLDHIASISSVFSYKTLLSIFVRKFGNIY